MTSALFQTLQLGDLRLRNRVIMSAMTRARAPQRVPTADMATYYAQRAGAGLIISEATTVSAQANGSIATPGIYTDEQQQGWQQVTDAVHARGGLIACQLWHTGRVSHASMQENNQQPVSASDVHGQVNTFTAEGFEQTTAPRALLLDEIPAVVAEYASAAKRAIDAGFDAVEIHSGSGYLPDQFLRDGTNQRGDAYGGSIDNRMRFVCDIVEAVIAAVGAGRTGIRFSPLLTTWDCSDSDPQALFSAVFARMNDYDLAFMDVTERNDVSIAIGSVQEGDINHIRNQYKGNYIANGAYDADSAAQAVASGHCLAVSFGRPYISTPDVAERFASGTALNPPSEPITWYGGGAQGYIDYPAMS